MSAARWLSGGGLAGAWSRVEGVDLAVLTGVQSATRATPVRAASRMLSRAGEHALAPVALGLLGAAVDRPRQGAWLRATGTVAASHLLSVVLKRVVRRGRPVDLRVEVLVPVPSRWSFPSSHATSTTAAAVAYGRVLGRRLPWVAVGPMALSRLVLGVHHPTDVAAGVLLGVLAGTSVDPGPGGTP